MRACVCLRLSCVTLFRQYSSFTSIITLNFLYGFLLDIMIGTNSSSAEKNKPKQYDALYNRTRFSKKYITGQEKVLIHKCTILKHASLRYFFNKNKNRLNLLLFSSCNFSLFSLQIRLPVINS